MADVTAEQFGELVASMVALSQALSANAQIAAATTPGGGADRCYRGGRKLPLKAVNRVNKFATLCSTLLKVVEQSDETDTLVVRALDGEHADRLGWTWRTCEVLVTVTEGDATHGLECPQQ